ncbi:unnamed protein product [Heligmosomoides polygyrus]|uniref:ZnMc domain-containing protein n=1 Tax=Heligmosomoides polygyrus TaxID=6339 RepID=A0A183GVJ6_HELPZ|nr:unnamed protein product [Heligmosomoides polygyrus]
MPAAYLLTVCLSAILVQALHAEPRFIDIFNVGGEQDIMQLRSGPRKLFNAIEPNSTRKWETKDQSGFFVIPYVISADYGAKTSTITAAMQSIAENTCIRFKARGNEPDYVEIQNVKGKGCSAFVGHSPGSNPVMLENNNEATYDVIGTAKEPSANDYRKVCLAYGCQTCMESKMP